MENFKHIPEKLKNLASGLDATCSPEGVIAVTILPRLLPRAFQRDTDPRFKVEFVGQQIRDKEFVEHKIYLMADSLIAQLLREFPTP